MRKVDFTSNKFINQSEVVIAIKANDNSVLRSIYTANFHKIEAFVLKNNGTKEHAKDIYQDAFLAVWKNIKQDKFVPQNENSIHGYLYTIAKNKWMDYLRSNQFKNTINSDEFQFTDTNQNVEEKIDNDEEYVNRLKKGMSAYKKLGSSCKELLAKFYFENKSMNEIAAELKLDSASTRNKKYRCMMKLKALALK